MTKRKSMITIVIFAFLIGSAWLIWPFARGSLEGVNTENRSLAEFPEFSFETLAGYPDQIESWVNDHLPFRGKMIELNSLIDYYLLHTSSNDNVVIGKDGWLFLKADASLDYYTGRKRFSEDQLHTLAENLQITKDELEEQGTEFALMVIPDRERIYPEELPDCYGAPNPNNAFDQVISYLRENTDIPVVCPYDSLMQAKAENPDQILYHKTDSHWNDLGAYIGVCDLFQALGVKWDGSRVSVSEIEDTPGDMADMLHLRGKIDAGKAYQLSGFQHDNTVRTEADFWGHYTFESPDAENGSILVLRDSFCSAMMPYLSEAFTKSDLVHHDGFSNELIGQEQPDYFVYEVVERKLDQLMDYSYNDLACETDLIAYLDRLMEKKDRYCILISAMDDASKGMTPELAGKLEALGVENDLTGQYRKSFYSVIDSGKNIAEDISKERLEWESTLKNGVRCYVMSGGFRAGAASSILMDGEEWSKAKRGLNIVVYDNEYHKVLDSVNFDTYDEEWTAYR